MASTSQSGTADDHDADVLVVEYGPVGQLLAVLSRPPRLAGGCTGTMAEPLQMPQAVGFGSEAARILAMADVGDSLVEPAQDYARRGATGETLIEFEIADRGHRTWLKVTSAYQLALGAAPIARGGKMVNLRVLRGHKVVRLTDMRDHVELVANDLGGQRVLSGRWVIGCDGANSFVCTRAGMSMTDLRFSHEWLVCDVRLHKPREFRPNNLQICDPARPRTAASGGPGHRRYKFTRVAGDDIRHFSTAEKRVKAAPAVRRDTGQRHTGSAGSVHVPGQVGGAVAVGADLPCRGRGAPHVAVRHARSAATQHRPNRVRPVSRQAARGRSAAQGQPRTTGGPAGMPVSKLG